MGPYYPRFPGWEAGRHFFQARQVTDARMTADLEQDS